MKKNVWLILLAAPLVLAACQDNASQKTAVAAHQAAPAMSATASAENTTLTSEMPSQPAAASQTSAARAVDTVAVTKAKTSNVGASVQQSMEQAKAEATASVAELAGQPASGKATAKVEQAKKIIAAPVKKVQQAAAAHVPASKSAVALKPSVAQKPVAAIAPVAVLAVAGDAGRGKSIARKCQACHNFTDKRKVGPGLKGVFGRKAGKMPDMKYSASLASATWTWDAQKLALWVCNSTKAVKTLTGDSSAKTKMPPQHICDPGKQADLIAFLKTL